MLAIMVVVVAILVQGVPAVRAPGWTAVGWSVSLPLGLFV
jgi:hypothetical protein